jgi:predicted aspartyl protease
LDQSWNYNREHIPPAPIVELGLAGFPVELTIDTGFGGGILIPFSLFQSLSLLNALIPDSYHAIMPDSRRVRLYTARAEVNIGSTKLLVDIHSSPLVERKLAGRSFLKSFITVLDGKREKLTLRTPVAK